MLLKRILFTTLFIHFFNLSAIAAATDSPLKGTVIKACEDEAEWPPYTYYLRDAAQKPTPIITGLSVDVASEILTKQGAKFEPELLPWARCEDQVKKGNLFQFALNATYSTERAQDYLISDPIYNTTSAYFYDVKYHPDGLKIEALSDLKKYKICGLFGYNYTAYGIEKNSPNLDNHAKYYSEIIKKLKNQSCDLFIEKIEVVQGKAKIGQVLINDNIKWGRIPMPKQDEFHYLISKKWDKSNALLKALNDGLAEMKQNGDMKKLLDKYGICN